MRNEFDDREGLDDAATPQGRLLYSRLAKHVRLRQLQLLVALQQCGSVVQAAATLHMSAMRAVSAPRWPDRPWWTRCAACWPRWRR
jgi:hypothetical protein